MSDSPAPQIFVGRQPILDNCGTLVAYELLFRSADAHHRAEFLDPTQATATVIANAFTELSGSHILGNYLGFINVDQDLLFSELIEVLPPSAVVLEILESVYPTPEVIERCRTLHEMGFSLAVDDLVQINEDYRRLLDLAEFIKVDILNLDEAERESLAANLKCFGKKLLAEKVETPEQFAHCQKLGFDLYQGYFFAKPSLIVGKKLNPAQLALMRLLGLIMEDADTSEIEKAFKLEPGLTVNMLRLTNSAACGLSTRVTSLRHAITILGRRQLQRWLQLLIYTNPKGAAQEINPLLQLAATRGRLMELLADRIQFRNREFADHAFMVGIMSLMPALLGVAMADILDQLPVAPRVKQALTDHGGPHGQLLHLVEATEQADPDVLAEAHAALPAINSEQLEHALQQALYWANHLGQSNESGDTERA